MATTLKAALDAFRLSFIDRIPADIAQAMADADAELAATGITQSALGAGGTAPNFILQGADGRFHSLATLLAQGPLVISFYRGGWCPYCNLELRALQRVLPQITALGAQLVAISPERPDQALSTAEANALAFPVLHDAGSAVARRYGLAFDLAQALRPIYARLGHALPERNGDGAWVLPIPATYVVGQDGVVRLAFVDSNYRNRLEPDAIIAALQRLARQEQPA